MAFTAKEKPKPNKFGPALFFQTEGTWDRDGLFSFCHRHQFCRWGKGKPTDDYLVEYFLDTGRLNEGLEALCRRVGHAVPEKGFGPPENTAPTYDPTEFYDDELIDRVYAADRDLIDRFDLLPFSGSVKGPLIRV